MSDATKKAELPTVEGGPSGEQCGTCYFFEQSESLAKKAFEENVTHEGEAVGFCRRYPPVLARDMELTFLDDKWLQPCLFGDNWCGEWRAKPGAKGAEPESYKISIDDLRDDWGRKIWCRNSLWLSGIRTVGDLVKLTAWEIGSIKSCGETSLKAIRYSLSKMGLKLKGDA